jgi:hypothetical protein
MKNGCVVEPEHAKQPPDAGRPVDVLGTVKHHACAFSDAEGGHYRSEFPGSGSHQWHPVARIGKLGQHVDELRARNMPVLEVLPARADFEHRHRIKGDMHRAIEDAEVGLPEMRRQPFGFDQKLGMDKLFRSCCHVRPSCLCKALRVHPVAGGRQTADDRRHTRGQRLVALGRARVEFPSRVVPLGSALVELTPKVSNKLLRIG